MNYWFVDTGKFFNPVGTNQIITWCTIIPPFIKNFFERIVVHDVIFRCISLAILLFKNV